MLRRFRGGSSAVPARARRREPVVVITTFPVAERRARNAAAMRAVYAACLRARPQT